MSARPVTFWIALLAVVMALAVVLREILLPFVAAMALAYLLDPFASRLERLGLNRLTATLAIMALFIVSAIALVLMSAPIIARELAHFVENVPLYLKQLHELTTDSSRPWLSRIVGGGLETAERSFGELTSLAAGWFGAFLHSAWSGGEALLSIFSLLIVAPIAACYLIYDWKKMIGVVDNWVPPERRGTVRMLAREIDDTIGGFVRGQSALCQPGRCSGPHVASTHSQPGLPGMPLGSAEFSRIASNLGRQFAGPHEGPSHHVAVGQGLPTATRSA